MFLEDKPWLVDAFKVLELGLTTYFIDGKSFKRLTIIVLDNAIEIAMWNYLKYEKDIQPPQNGFNEIIRKVKSNSPEKEHKESFFNKIKYYHEQRNPLYHQGVRIMDIPKEEMVKQCVVALGLFEFLFKEEFEEFLLENKNVNFIKEYLELEQKILDNRLNRDEIQRLIEITEFIESNCPYEGLPFNNVDATALEDNTDTLREINNSLSI